MKCCDNNIKDKDRLNVNKKQKKNTCKIVDLQMEHKLYLKESEKKER